MEATYIMFIILYMFLQRVGEIFTNSSLFAAWGGGIVPEEQENRKRPSCFQFCIQLVKSSANFMEEA